MTEAMEINALRVSKLEKEIIIRQRINLKNIKRLLIC